MGASISRSISESKNYSKGKTMKRRGRGKSMRNKRRTLRNKRRTMRKQRGGYVYSDKREHRSTVGRGVTMSRPKSHKKRTHKKSRK